MRPTRRRVLAALSLSFVAGCSGPGVGDTPETDGRRNSPTATPIRDRAATEMPTDTPEETLDLREANVTAVTISGEDEGVRFEVTLYHDDDGEDGYANWWQVETLDGTALGRRELTHPHGTRPFTRSARIAVPTDTVCVVVRGHDETHGYGGQAALVNLDSGGVRLVGQGPDLARFDASDCP